MVLNMYENDLYAGVLGKIIGVYFGRPIEGWKYDDIQNRFGYIDHFLHSELNTDLIEVDDDISGTFNFIRVLEDGDITYRSISDYWRNQIIENKTIFWWGGIFRSTEHTAYWRLKNGYDAPESGSYKLNGKTVATQIGSQIFIDGFGLSNPNNPKEAKRMAMIASSVSHDLIAIDMAAYIAVLEAIVFKEKDLIKALYLALNYFDNDELKSYIDEMVDICKKYDDYRNVRNYIEENHPYHKYGGNCPVVTNFLVIIASLLLAKDDFKKAIAIAASMGYDTDCNAGNVGCIEGIRLGLDGINKSNLKEIVNEKMYVVGAYGSRVFNNATNIAKEIIYKRNIGHKYNFDYDGSTCGFDLINIEHLANQNGLYIEYHNQSVLSKDTFYIPTKVNQNNYQIVATPSLYFGQTIEIKMSNETKYYISIEYLDGDNELKVIKSNILCGNAKYQLDENYAYLITKFELHFIDEGETVIEEIKISGSANILYKDLYKMSPKYIVGRDIPSWYYGFIDTTTNSTVDHLSTICLSHEYDNGLLYTGSEEFYDYSIKSIINISNQEEVGLIGRFKGLGSYYRLSIRSQKIYLDLLKNYDIKTLYVTDFNYQADDDISMEIKFINNQIICQVNDICFKAEDNTYTNGLCGLTISKGTALIKELKISNG